MIASHADELVDAMSELRVLFPAWRMGQLVANLVVAAGGTESSAIWDIEDEMLLAAARRIIERNRGRVEVRVDHSCRTNGGETVGETASGTVVGSIITASSG